MIDSSLFIPDTQTNRELPMEKKYGNRNKPLIFWKNIQQKCVVKVWGKTNSLNKI